MAVKCSGSVVVSGESVHFSKTANRRPKVMKIWDSVFYRAHMGHIYLLPDSLNLVGSFGALCLVLSYQIRVVVALCEHDTRGGGGLRPNPC